MTLLNPRQIHPEKVICDGFRNGRFLLARRSVELATYGRSRNGLQQGAVGSMVLREGVAQYNTDGAGCVRRLMLLRSRAPTALAGKALTILREAGAQYTTMHRFVYIAVRGFGRTACRSSGQEREVRCSSRWCKTSRIANIVGSRYATFFKAAADCSFTALTTTPANPHDRNL